MFRYAALSALTALVPVPGVGVAVDVACMVTLGKQLVTIFGLDTLDADNVLGLSKAGATAASSIQATVAVLTVGQAILALLTEAGSGYVVAKAVSWIPFLGAVVSAGITFTLCYKVGNNMLDKSVEAAEAAERVMVERMAAAL